METAFELFERIYAEAERASCCVVNAVFTVFRSYAVGGPPTIEIPDFMRLNYILVDGEPQVVLTADQFGLATECVCAFEEFAEAINAAAAARGMTRDGGPALPDKPCDNCGDPLCGYYRAREPFFPGIIAKPKPKKVPK